MCRFLLGGNMADKNYTNKLGLSGYQATHKRLNPKPPKTGSVIKSPKMNLTIKVKVV